MIMRVAVAVSLIAVPTGASGQSQTAEDAIRNSRRVVMGPEFGIAAQDCSPSADPDIIVVCGSNVERERQRVPPSPVLAGDLRGRGDPGNGMAAMGADRCIRLCLQPIIIPLLTVPLGPGVGGQTRTGIDEIRDALGDRPQ